MNELVWYANMNVMKRELFSNIHTYRSQNNIIFVIFIYLCMVLNRNIFPALVRVDCGEVFPFVFMGALGGKQVWILFCFEFF